MIPLFGLCVSVSSRSRILSPYPPGNFGHFSLVTASKWAVSKLEIRQDTSETVIGVFVMSNQVTGWHFRMPIHHPIWGPTTFKSTVAATITPSTPAPAMTRR